MSESAQWTMHFTASWVLFLGIGLALCGLMLDWHRGNVEGRSAMRTQDAVRLGLLSQTLRNLQTQGAAQNTATAAWQTEATDAYRELSSASRRAGLGDAKCNPQRAAEWTGPSGTDPLPEAELRDYLCYLGTLSPGDVGANRPTSAQLQQAHQLAGGLQVVELNRAIHERTLADRLQFWHWLLFMLGIPLMIANKVGRARARAV